MGLLLWKRLKTLKEAVAKTLEEAMALEKLDEAVALE